MTMTKYESTLALAADSPEQLRTSDVFRVVEAADNGNFLSGFCSWLSNLRPDLIDEISECREDL